MPQANPMAITGETISFPEIKSAENPVDIRATRLSSLELIEKYPNESGILQVLAVADVSRAINAWQKEGNRLLIIDMYRAYREAGLVVPEDVLALLDMIASDLLNAKKESQLVSAVVGKRQKGKPLGRRALDAAYSNLEIFTRFLNLTDASRGADKKNQRQAWKIISKETGRKFGGIESLIKETRREAKRLSAEKGVR